MTGISFESGLLILITFLALALKKYSGSNRANSSKLPLPPGPKPWPIIGNLLDTPKISPWITFQKWGRVHGDIVSFSVFGQAFVILNSRRVAVDLYDKRSKIYSDKPNVPLLERTGWDFNLGTMPYGSKWRAHRRTFHEKFRPDAAVSYRPVQLSSMHALLRGILEDPVDYMGALRTFSASIVMYTMYGHQIAPKNDRFVKIAQESVDMLSVVLMPGVRAVDFFPFLWYFPSWFPGAGFKTLADKCKRLTDEMQNVPFNFVKENMKTGSGVSSVTSDLLEHNKLVGGPREQEDVIKRVAAVAYAAGADTTTAAIASAMLAMVLYPEAQKRAQAEINRVVGTERLPDFDDRESLPFVDAFYREVMRWHPTTPLASWHITSDDDVYEGMFIPKGAYVTPNVWAITHNENVYPNPDEFQPERFLNSDGQLNDDSQIITFGMGRRICAGRYMADATIWGAIAGLLSVFEFSRTMDESGKEIDIQPLFGGSIISHPLPFKCSITPRSQEARVLIQSTVPLTSST